MPEFRSWKDRDTYANRHGLMNQRSSYKSFGSNWKKRDNFATEHGLWNSRWSSNGDYRVDTTGEGSSVSRSRYVCEKCSCGTFECKGK
mmetsp:Transcript_37627/g.33253  ORF Transcript_37627/g.33253 Transcript_37627/m.33253 type:complete len:88 (-) Transcript_37627:264-527(-)